MMTLNDGRSELWQWDTGRTLSVDADCSQVHFSNKVFGRSIDVDVADGVATIPDVLLQTDNDLNVWAFVGTAENGYTKISKTFKVNRRNKPADYVFTPVEQTTIAEIAAIAQSVRDDADAGLFNGERGADGGWYTPSVTQPDENTLRMAFAPSKDDMPAVADTDITIPSGGSGSDIVLDTTLSEAGKAADAKAVGDALAGKQPKGDYLTQDNLQDATNAALAQAKESGAFDGEPGADGKSAYQYAQEGGYTGTEAEFAAKLAQEIPSALPSPNALTFTGAVTGSYDGSQPVTVNIPSGGSGSGAEKTWSLLLDETLSEDTAYIFQDLSAPVSELLIEFLAGGDGTHRNVTIFNRKGAGYGNNIVTFENVLRTDETVIARFVIHCVAFPDLAFFRCQYNNYNGSVGNNVINTSSALIFDNENGAFKGSTNFDCISIGCWGGGNSGVFKAGSKVKVYGKT